MADPTDILKFGFGDDPEVKREQWFKGGPAFDDACRQFEPDWAAARAFATEAQARAAARHALAHGWHRAMRKLERLSGR